jgi:signal transduction histidine kinase
MRSLNWKLTLALLLVVAVSVGLTAYLTNLRTASEFSQYVSQGRLAYVEQLQETLSDYYADTGSWQGVQGLFDDLPQYGSYRLVLADNSGVIVGDTDGDWLGDTASQIGLTDPASVVVSGEHVGALYLASSSTGHGQGKGQMAGPGGAEQQPLTGEEQDFLNRFNTSLIIAAAVGAVVAILLGLVLTRQITRPIKELKKGASRIAAGRLGYRVKVKSKDEFGELARSFNSMAASLQNGEEARQRLLADIAHELRTPLSVIEGTVDAMLDGVFEADASNLLSIKEETALLTRLVADLRDLSLAESGQLKLDLEPVDLADLVRRLVSQTEVIARQKDITLRLDTAEQLPQVQADGKRIEQVVANLLSNALHHTPAGGSVAVTVARAGSVPGCQGGKDDLLVSVADTGEGIPAEHLPHIFERFYRVDDARSRKRGGAGLGLAIARQMVELHRGRIWVDSDPGKGSRFSFTLPVSGQA